MPFINAYLAQSYPSIVADMLSSAIACIGFTWVESIKNKIFQKLNFYNLQSIVSYFSNRLLALLVQNWK